MMNKAVPKIKETAAEIREMLKNESQVKKQNRLQALYLIVKKQAKSRSKVAEILGFNRNSISAWFKLYEAGGLEKMLEIQKPSGAKAKMTAEAIAEIKEVLASEKGFRTYKEIHQMVVTKHSIEIGYGGVHKLVRYQLEAKAKSPRPSNPKKKSLKLLNLEQESEKSSKK
jgi:transposase